MSSLTAAKIYITKYLLPILLVLFVGSRVIFINPGVVFFDSPEYLSRMSDPSFIRSVTTGHVPLHSGYMIIAWPVYHFAETIHLPGELLVVIIQVLLATVTIMFFYKLTHLLFNHYISLLACIIVSLTPLWWITTDTIMMESIYIPCIIAAVYYTLKFARDAKPTVLSAMVGSFLYACAIFTHFGLIVWLPFMIALVFILNKQRFVVYCLILAPFVILSLGINAWLISYGLKAPLQAGITELLFAKLREKSVTTFSISSVLSLIRTLIIPLLRNFTIVLTLLVIPGIFSLYRREKKSFLIILLWLLPILVANLWWDSLLFGRHSLFALFAAALAAAYFLQRRPVLTVLVLVYLFVTTVPSLLLLRSPVPYISLAEYAKTLPHNSLYIESHFARPQIESAYNGNHFFVDEPGYDLSKLPQMINYHLSQNRQVFISSQALSEPYGLFSGPYLHILSLSYKYPERLTSIMNKYRLVPKKTLPGKITMYQVISYTPSAEPVLPYYKYSRRRIDYPDPIIQLWMAVDAIVLHREDFKSQEISLMEQILQERPKD